MSIIYYTTQGKFETDDRSKIPWGNLHSPNDKIPALIYTTGTKYWCDNGKFHRLTGPAKIWKYGGYIEFWINGNKYSFEDWCKIHPDKTLLALYLLKN